MAKNFELEIRETYSNQYLKVFLKNNSIIDDVREKIADLKSVKTVNISESQSKSNSALTLTIYPKRVYDIEEVRNEVGEFLEVYFNDASKFINDPIIIETREWLGNHPASQKLYNEAIEKCRQNLYQRNILDDMRLSLETLLKDILNNQKSLENQLPEIGSFQKNRGLSVEFSNMFHKLLDYYSKYQNSYVKHNDAVNPSEIDFIIQLTVAFMRNLMK